MTPDERFDDLAAQFADAGVTTGALFGKRALKLQGKAIACLKGDDLAFRLGEGTAAHAAALALDGAELFDPSGKHRPFKDWVSVPSTLADRWEALLLTAVEGGA